MDGKYSPEEQALVDKTIKMVDRAIEVLGRVRERLLCGKGEDFSSLIQETQQALESLEFTPSEAKRLVKNVQIKPGMEVSDVLREVFERRQR